MTVAKSGSPPTVVIEAVVERVYPKRGYAVTRPRERVPELDSNDSITFSLEDWAGQDPPQKGQIVILRNIVLFEKGWRAKAEPKELTAQRKEARSASK